MAALHYELAQPEDGDLDSFDCGDIEVNHFFRSRQWFNKDRGEISPPTYQFLTADKGSVIGYAAATIGNSAHPDDLSTTKKKYLVIYALGVYQHFHGVVNPASNETETYATSMLRIFEGFALDRRTCMGMSLRVRDNNARAKAFYARFGFIPDPGGPVQRDKNGTGVPHLTMRKLLLR